MTLRRLLIPLFLLFALAPAALQGQERLTRLGGSLYIAPGSYYEPDVICVLCRIEAQGELRGNLLLLFGSARIEASAYKDVIAIGSRVEASPGAALQHDLVSLFSFLRLGDGASLGDSLTSALSVVHVGRTVTIGSNLIAIFDWLAMAPAVDLVGRRIVAPLWLLLLPSPFLLLFAVFCSDESRARKRRAQARQRYVDAGGKLPGEREE